MGTPNGTPIEYFCLVTLEWTETQGPDPDEARNLEEIKELFPLTADLLPELVSVPDPIIRRGTWKGGLNVAPGGNRGNMAQVTFNSACATLIGRAEDRHSAVILFLYMEPSIIGPGTPTPRLIVPGSY
jgi:hypothetical protein